MKTVKSLATLTLCLLSAFSTLVVLDTQRAKAGKICSNRTLYGTYVNQSEGYVNYTQPYAITSIITYNGDGTSGGTVLANSVAGNVTTNVATRGKYQVNSDCSVTISVTRDNGTTANFSGVIFDDGNKFNVTQTDAGTIVNLKGERIRNYTHPTN